MKRVVIGTRGSRLARAQSEWVAAQIRRHHPAVEIEITVIRTTGDKMTTASLVALAANTKGLFVKELEETLLAGEVDLAVHSLKDVPTELPDGLVLGPTPVREDPRDVLLTREPVSSLADLPKAARVATSSLRRQIQLERLRPDLRVVPIRGNVDTRLRKLESEELGAVVLAAAGINRLGLAETVAALHISTDEMIPAVGQGALALELRRDHGDLAELLAPLEHAPSHAAVEAERQFLVRMGGGCQVPMGAYAASTENGSSFIAFVADPKGECFLRGGAWGPPGALTRLAAEVASQLEAEGATELLSRSTPSE